MRQRHTPHFYEKYIKRPQDFCLSLGAIVILSPVMAVTAVLVRTKLGTPVLFCQDRPGKDGRIFKMYKFRTMTDAKDSQGKLLPDEERLTAFGKKLRATSLDELPELFNILKGDMAIVGPRPLLVQYLPLYNQHQRRRHEVRPGFTGLAQINGRNSISWEEKFDYDVEYVDSIRFIKDWEIIFKTIKTVLKREGISSNTSVTMEEFHGTQQGQEGCMSVSGQPDNGGRNDKQTKTVKNHVYKRRKACRAGAGISGRCRRPVHGCKTVRRRSGGRCPGAVLL